MTTSSLTPIGSFSAHSSSIHVSGGSSSSGSSECSGSFIPRFGVSAEAPPSIAHRRVSKGERGSTEIEGLYVSKVLLPKILPELMKKAKAKTITLQDLSILKKHDSLGIDVYDCDETMVQLILTKGDSPQSVYDFVNTFNSIYVPPSHRVSFIRPQSLLYSLFHSMPVDFPFVKSFFPMVGVPHQFSIGVAVCEEDLSGLMKIVQEQGIQPELFTQLQFELSLLIDRVPGRAVYVPYIFLGTVERLARQKNALPSPVERHLVQRSIQVAKIERILEGLTKQLTSLKLK